MNRYGPEQPVWANCFCTDVKSVARRGRVKSLPAAGKEVERKKVMKGKGKGNENASDNERKEEGEGE